MNILLTGSCNISCPYCFADEYLGSLSDRKRLAFRDYRRILDFLKRSNVWAIQLAGGEPTLHREFAELLDYAIVEGFVATILSNGVFSQRVRDHLYRRREHFRLLCMNINEPGFYSRKQWDMIRANLAILGSKTALGVNIFRPDQELEYVIDLAREFGVKGIRCVYAHQSGGTANPAIMPYETVVRQTSRLAEFVERAGTDLGMRVSYDCGFVPCLYSDTQLGTFSRWRTKLGQCSKNVYTIDADLNISHCFNRDRPNHVAHLDSFETMSDIDAFFSVLHQTEPPLFEECTACAEKLVGTCDGGCIADRRVLGTVGTRPTLRCP